MTRKEREDIIWLAAFFNGEGSIGMYEHYPKGTMPGYEDRVYHSWRICLTLTNTDEEIIREMWSLFGGTITQNRVSGRENIPKNNTCYHLTWTGRKAERLAQKIYPYLKGRKKEQCGQFLYAMKNWPRPHLKGNGRGGRLPLEAIQLRQKLANSVNQYNAMTKRRKVYSTLSQATDTVNEVNDVEGATTIHEPRKG